MTTSRRTQQAGSIPLALLAAIVIGGVIVALYAVTMSGVRSSARDRDLSAAIHVADAGLQEAFVALQATNLGDRPACDVDSDGTCSGTLRDGSAYSWQYEVLGARLWRVTALGEHNDQARVVQADIGQRPLFAAAVVTRRSFTYNGAGNGASFPVGAFGAVTTNGTNARDSILELLLYDDNENIPGGGSPIPPTKWVSAAGPDLPNLGLAAFEDGGVCAGGTESLTNPIERRTYCLNGATSLRNVTLASGDDPAIIYIQGGGLDLDSINVGGDAEDLQFYVGEGDVVMSGNAQASAAVYAPASSCTFNGNPSFDGGIICNDLTLNGNFGYDDSVTNISEDTFAIRGWHEQAPSAFALP
jgi:hypothetical protein